jgi:hypothetical protein
MSRVSLLSERIYQEIMINDRGRTREKSRSRDAQHE